MKRLWDSLIFAAVVLIVSNAHAAEQIDGKIARIDGSTVTIETDSLIDPKAGDAVEFGLVLPPQDKFEMTALGRVTQVNGNQVVVEVVATLQEITELQVARITTENSSAPDATLVITKTQNGRSDLFLIRADGSEVKNLTAAANLAGGSYPAWSPDGTKIVFMSMDSANVGLFIMDADGSNPIHLTHGPDAGAAWSPDGRRIAFTRYPEGTSESPQIFVIELTGTEIVGESANLTDGTSYDADPAWSPDGTQIAFASNRSGAFRLYVMNADGTNVRDISQANNPNGSIYPAWSPDGRRIAYTDLGADGRRHLFVIDADGSNKQQIAGQGELDTYAAWSPDGGKIIYVSSVGQQATLIEINPDGSGARTLGAFTSALGCRPAWKPKWQVGR